MICVGCAAGADMIEDYREAARKDDARRAEPLKPEAARRWIRKRARWALSQHCGKLFRASRPSGCTCQCLIPELRGNGGPSDAAGPVN